MPDNKLKPQDKTKLRIDKDKREFNRLNKILKKLLVEGNSPLVYDYVQYYLDNLENPIEDAEYHVNNALEVDEFDMDEYFTDAEERALAAVNLWGKEYQQILKGAETRAFSELYDYSTEELEAIQDATGVILDRLDALDEGATEEMDDADKVVIVVIDDEKDDVKDDLDDADTRGAGFWANALTFVIEFPETMVLIQRMIRSFVEIDPDKYIEDAVEMQKVQKRLQERLDKEKL